MSFDTAHFRKHGYQVFKGVLSVEDVDQVHRFLQSHVADQVAEVGKDLSCSSVEAVVQYATEVAESGPDAIKALPKPISDTLTGHFAVRVRLARELWTIPLQPRLQELVRLLIGSEQLYLHMPPVARFVLPCNVHAGVPAHQDISYNQHLSDFLVVWVPLVAIDDDCGGVLVYHGSGHGPALPVPSDKDQYWLKGVSTDGYEPIHCKLGVGDVLVLNKFVIHQSMPNRSSRTRLSMDLRFFGAREQTTKHFLDLQSLEVVPPAEDTQHETV